MSGQNPSSFVSFLSRTLAEANRFIVEQLKQRGLSDLVPSHGDILVHLFAHEPVTMQELAQAINRDPSTVTALVRKLSDAGYVRTAKARPATSASPRCRLPRKAQGCGATSPPFRPSCLTLRCRASTTATSTSHATCWATCATTSRRRLMPIAPSSHDSKGANPTETVNIYRQRPQTSNAAISSFPEQQERMKARKEGEPI